MSLLLIIIVLVLLFGGGGYYGYRGGYYGGGGFGLVGLILLVVVLWLIFGGGFAHAQQTNGYGNFYPNAGARKDLTCATASSSQTWSAAADLAATDFYVTNVGSVESFIRYGIGAQTSSATTDINVTAGTTQVFHKGKGDTFACITASGTSTLRVTPGYGR